MARLEGFFTQAGDVSASIRYAAGQTVSFGLAGEWPRARIQVEVSPDNLAWAPGSNEYGLQGASYCPYEGGPPAPPGMSKVNLPGAGWFRLRAIEFESGYCQWTVSND